MNMQRAVVVWTLEPAERDAKLANEAAKKATAASNYAIMEIALTRTSHELFLTRQAYLARFKTSLEEDVAYHITGNFRKVCFYILFNGY